MQKYIERLVECGYPKERAESLCHDMCRNCGYVALVLFVEDIESRT